MARRKKQDNTGVWALLIMAAFIALLTFTAIAAIAFPLALLAFWAWHEIAARSAAPAFDSMQPTSAENIAVAEARHKHEIIQREIKQLELSQGNLRQSGNGLAVRNDGLFDERSQKGRDLNRDITAIDVRISEKNILAEEQEDNVDSVLSDINNRKYECQNSYVRKKSAGLALASYVVAACITYFLLPGLGRGIGNLIAGFSLIKFEPTLLGTSAISAIPAFIAWKAGLEHFARKFERINREEYEGFSLVPGACAAALGLILLSTLTKENFAYMPPKTSSVSVTATSPAMQNLTGETQPITDTSVSTDLDPQECIEDHSKPPCSIRTLIPQELWPKLQSAMAFSESMPDGTAVEFTKQATPVNEKGIITRVGESNGCLFFKLKFNNQISDFEKCY